MSATSAGTGDPEPDTDAPVVEGWSGVAIGAAHACGVRTDGTMWCWGDNASGQLGVPDVGMSMAPVRVGQRTDWSAVWALASYTCARGADGLWCWGRNEAGQLGIGVVSDEPECSPVQSLVPPDFVDLSLGPSHACARTMSGELLCWGEDYTATAEASGTPTTVAIGAPVVEHGVGSAHVCALTSGLGVRCWGNGTAGQLGTGDVEREPVPTLAFEGLEIDKLALVVFLRTCVRDVSGSTHCVGRNHRAQFGNEMMADSVVQPQPVPALDGLRLRGGIEHTCGLAEGGRLFCWGGNEYGQVGDGSTEIRTTPVQIGGSNWTALSACSLNTCAIDVDARLWCWGRNHRGQVGDGASEEVQSLPSEVIAPES